MFLSVVILFLLVNESCAVTWHYNYQRDKCGPEKWDHLYDYCNLTIYPNQSPIDIISEEAKKVKVSDDKFGIWTFDEITENAPNKPAESLTKKACHDCIKRKFNKKTFIITDFRKEKNQPGSFQVTDPKGNKFFLEHIWFHYGSNSTRGSDHRIDGKAFPLEMQFVFIPNDIPDFGEANEALNYSIMAIGVFAKLSDEDNPFFEPLLYKQLTNTMRYDYVITWDVLLPNYTHSGYYFYEGSETNPACHPYWYWFIFEEPLHYISERQLDVLRQAKESSTDCETHKNAGSPVSSGDNFRPIMPLNDREVLYFQKVPQVPSGASVDDKSSKLVIFIALVSVLMNYA